MRIALLSDVHGNLSGLRAVAEALQREGPFHRVVVAGDHLQGGPCPLEVWEALHKLGWALVRGNEDESLAAETPPGVLDVRQRYRRAYLAQHAWFRRVLPAGVLRELGRLPVELRIDSPAGELLVVHSSPRGTRDLSGGPHNSVAEVTAAYSGTGASAIAFGHYHHSFVRPMPFTLLVNVASVGLPLDGQSLSAYTILSAVDGGWLVEQRRVPFEASAEEAAARARGLPPWEPDQPAPESQAIAP